MGTLELMPTGGPEGPQSDSGQTSTLPKVANVEAALNLNMPTSFRFGFAGSEREFIVPPVPWTFGSVLQDLQNRSDRLKELPETEQMVEILAICDRAIPLFPQLCYPKSWLARQLMRFRNPFSKASWLEVAVLIGFFFGCQMKSTVQGFSTKIDPGSHHRLTLRTN